jgi:hypothetical protein
MKIRSLGLVFMFSAAVLTAAAQKTVTNTDLEHYRNDRVQAEEKLRQDYERKGTSYDEVMRHNKESQKETIDLAAKLRAERLEEEKLDAERSAAEQAAAANRQMSVAPTYYQDPYYGYGYGGYGYGYGYGNGSRGRGGFRFPYQQQGYYAGGQFWPTSPATPPRPAWSVPRSTPIPTPHGGGHGGGRR